jgi:hypothetical protein
MAHRVCKYLLSQFPYCKDGKLTVWKNPVPENERNSAVEGFTFPEFWWCANWVVGFPANHDYWNRFTNTKEKVQSAAGDFVAGYELGYVEAHHNVTQDWALSVGKAELKRLQPKVTEETVT